MSQGKPGGVSAEADATNAPDIDPLLARGEKIQGKEINEERYIRRGTH